MPNHYKDKLKKGRPIVRKIGKAGVGGGKLLSHAGFKGTGRKVSQAGRAVRDASKVKNLNSAKKAINSALKALK